MKNIVFTSESVSEGHPDKLADRISDTVLDRFLLDDPNSKVACECLVTGKLVVIAGEVHTSPELVKQVRAELPGMVRHLIRETGYDGTFSGIDPAHCEIRLELTGQSPDIRLGVELDGETIGAGDQGLMFGYACDETPELMPLPIMLAHQLVQRQTALRKSGMIPWLRPDAKSQVSIRYRGTEPISVETIVLSTQHAADVDIDTVRSVLNEEIVRPIIPKDLQVRDTRVLINPTGRFVVGGPCGDAGLTGRKIIVDTYGGAAPHGGGAFSGKDPSKVDRSAAYAVRYVAKNLVASGLARRCTIQVAYAIGVPDPVSVRVDTHGTGTVSEQIIEKIAAQVFDLTPAGIIRGLRLRRPIYSDTAALGHFGRPDFTWESVDRVNEVKEATLC